jgi:hypothetical protein
MSREFKIANYEETLKLKISLGEALTPNYLARFIQTIKMLFKSIESSRRRNYPQAI